MYKNLTRFTVSDSPLACRSLACVMIITQSIFEMLRVASYLLNSNSTFHALTKRSVNLESKF